MNNWVVIQNQPLLKSIYTKTPIISYKRGKSLKDTLVTSQMSDFNNSDVGFNSSDVGF